jgi:hypothetical protein
VCAGGLPCVEVTVTWFAFTSREVGLVAEGQGQRDGQEQGVVRHEHRLREWTKTHM